jgi:hypothetical protein
MRIIDKRSHAALYLATCSFYHLPRPLLGHRRNPLVILW